MLITKFLITSYHFGFICFFCIFLRSSFFKQFCQKVGSLKIAFRNQIVMGRVKKFCAGSQTENHAHSEMENSIKPDKPHLKNGFRNIALWLYGCIRISVDFLKNFGHFGRRIWGLCRASLRERFTNGWTDSLKFKTSLKRSFLETIFSWNDLLTT